MKMAAMQHRLPELVARFVDHVLSYKTALQLELRLWSDSEWPESAMEEGARTTGERAFGSPSREGPPT